MDRLDPASFVRADEDKIGLHPTLQASVVRVAAGGDCESNRDGERVRQHIHRALPNRIPTCAFAISATSRCSNLSNNPCQTMPTSIGATMSCGKRASAS